MIEKKYYQPQFRNKKLKRKAIVLPKKSKSLKQNQEAELQISGVLKHSVAFSPRYLLCFPSVCVH